jgi:F-type H+-transporting ATPase subunit b
MFSFCAYRKSLLRFLVVWLAVLLVSPFAANPGGGLKLHAQEPGLQAAPAAPHPGDIEREEQKLAKEESKSADPAENLRHSSAVRWIARVTGLSIDGAFWICMFLNFAVIFFAVVIPLRKRLPGFFRSRTESIQRRVEEARKTSEEARRRLAEVEGRLSRLDAEITEMRREADEGARSEEKRMRAELELERERILTAAEQEITMAAGAARRELKSYAAELAVGLAEKRIRVDKDADQALVREFTASLGRDGN